MARFVRTAPGVAFSLRVAIDARRPRPIPDQRRGALGDRDRRRSPRRDQRGRPNQPHQSASDHGGEVVGQASLPVLLRAILKL